ncbi:MAG: flagellar biosynthesis protein FliQ [Rubinisphaera brasiliensis]|uniref:Flagellar biosynthetic protein FliQ n=1 Tax=Rubinisphaera brasiliensis (strain ATCC 49424 / DSM 5305 / JCM 21570 / IAM 15109 / NBRC 103401 / IFAM 1448) TaxID=756272 RepID=F0SNZ8_RUBBR|nr:flagellar biosynthesis protein FliQ [Rubinisphaera brasiliensis]ADY60074.1 flagellar biosynthetic protein FliQ [Rubinisphaera brasiliensis DSM 5305]MBB01465.1 flagellar biosynthetic protein FliQ [Planctomyces sp.]MBR9800709.1 flagellar biosynthesis protein FliQ [bacterium]
MDVDLAVEITRQAILLAVIVGAPVMLVAMLVGLVISLFQAVTQLQDQTLSFVPKILLMVGTVVVLLPWLIGQIVDYTHELWTNIPLNL